jgi:hypothetical protein
VNQYLSPEPGFTPDPKNNDNSVNYLRRLKAETDAETPSAPLDHQHPAAPLRREKRRSPRFRCTGSVSLTPEGTETRMWGTLTDISLRGCYVEMSSTVPVDSKVDLVMDASGFRIRAKGVVRISYPGLGMGILITELAPDQREFLDELLSALAAGTNISTSQLVQERTAADAVAAVDPIPFLHELRRFFTSKTTLTRDEFIRIADRCQRP